MKNLRIGAVALAVTTFFAAPALAENGVHDDKIVLGQSAAFDGPASALGTGMREGLEAAFKEANDAGGVHGRKIELKAYDDGYEPNKAIANTNRLIDQDQVFALIGEVGTPTSKAAPADFDPEGRALHRPVHRCRLPARPGQQQRGQRARDL